MNEPTNIPYRQLGREGEEEKDHRYWTHAPHEGSSTQIQERFPDRSTKGCQRTIHQVRVNAFSIRCSVSWAKGRWSELGSINGWLDGLVTKLLDESRAC